MACERWQTCLCDAALWGSWRGSAVIGNHAASNCIAPLGIKIDGDRDGIVLPRAPEVGCWRGEKIDGLLSDDRSQCHIRVFTESEKVKGQDGNTQERFWIRVEIGMPRLAALTVNPPNDPFALLFGN